MADLILCNFHLFEFQRQLIDIRRDIINARW